MKINRALFQEIIQTRAWADFQRPLVMSASFLVLAAFVYVIGLRPQIVGWQLARAEHAKVIKTFERYRDFGLFVKKIDEQKDQLVAQKDKINAADAVAEKSEQTFFETISDIGDKTGVRLTKTTPTTLADGRKAWVISFSADFRQIDHFLFLVEKKFVIEALTILSGQPAAKHTVDMTIANMFKSSDIEFAHNDVIERYTGKDLFVMYDEVARLLAGVARQRKIIDAYTAAPRDLMAYADTLFYVPPESRPATAKARPASEAPPVKIEDIFWDPDVPVVVIGGKAMRIGDSTNGVKILAINKKSIVVKYRDKDITIQK